MSVTVKVPKNLSSSQKELLRIVRSPEGVIAFDPVGKAPGRGAYVCHDLQCLKRAVKARAISRAFEIEIPQEIYDRLTAEMEAQS